MTRVALVLIAVVAAPTQVWAQTPVTSQISLAALKENYLKALDRATAPIHKTYEHELIKLKSECAKAGDHEAVLAIDTELKSLSQNVDPGSVSPTPIERDAKSREEPPKPIGAKEPRILKDFASIDDFQRWLATTEWLSEDNAYSYTFPSNGKQKLTYVPKGEVTTREVRVTNIGKVQWGTTNLIEMTIDANLREATVDNPEGSDPKTLKRSKP